MNSKIRQINHELTDRSLPSTKGSHFTAFLVPLMALNAFVLLPDALANAASCHVYAANIQGTTTSIFGSQQFSVNQYALWRDAGLASHPVEFLLFPPQDLNASPQVGQIQPLPATRV